jgi:putative ABC transport system permease protein
VDPKSLAATVKNEVAMADASLRVGEVATLDGLYSDATASRRFLLILLSVFGAVAFGLAVVGVYGVVAFAVSLRLREAGIRLALGARPSDIVKLILQRSAALILAGLAAGLLGTFVLRRLIASQLFGVSPLDPVTLAAGAGLIVTVLVAACYLPARRAANADPTIALRAE